MLDRMKVSTQETKRFVTGVWFNDGGELVGLEKDPEQVCFLVARDQNSRYLRELDRNRKTLKLNNPRQRKKLTNEQSIEATCRAMAAAILLDWHGVADLDGNELDGKDEDLRFRVLKAEPSFRELVATCAADFDAFNEAEGALTRDGAGKSRTGVSGGTGSDRKSSS